MRKVFSLSAVLIAMFASASAWSGVDYLVSPLGGVRGQLGNDGSVAYMSLDECLDEPCKDLILNGAVINDFVPMAGANPNLGVSHYRLNNVGDVLWTHHRSYMTPAGLPAVDVYVNSTLVDTVLGPSPSEYDQLEFGVDLVAFDDTGRGIWHSMAEDHGDNPIGPEEEFWFLAAPSGPASVPEPATAVLLALGLVGMGVRMRRR